MILNIICHILLGLLSFALGREVSPHSCSSTYRLTRVSLTWTWGISSQLLQRRTATTCRSSTTQPLLATTAPKVSISAWIYLWAFYFVPLIYISVFVSVPYCLDDYGFVIETAVRQVDSSTFILLSQDFFGYSRFFVFPYKL